MLVTKPMDISIIFDDNNPALCSPHCAHFRENGIKGADCIFYHMDLKCHDKWGLRYCREDDCIRDFGETVIRNKT